MDLEQIFLALFSTLELIKSGLEMIRVSLRGQNREKFILAEKYSKVGVFPTFEILNLHVLLSKFAHLLFQT